MSTPDHLVSSPTDGGERRRNPRLRELVDEMLASIRAATNADLWSPEERAAYEADMARIMDSVRQQALGGPAARARLE
ncbi:hypothetical protein [Gemmatimonas sp.]|jgi:hypothetical protein|uniref:hypothetical protein n=1 Tax=Gemmatimonas sp. TaxID=1962908 RepID=UPI0022C2DC3B|nr:hypothetical protein [Gemmatimonas sp.]MCZ8206110.1 hypothetical protein [Gemmatimonas sp.]